MDKNALIFEMRMGEEWTQVTTISFVDDPAIKKAFLKFKDEDIFHFNAIPEKRIVTGPVLIPDKIIPRKIDNTIFYIVFKADQIEQAFEKFMSMGAGNNTNIMHMADIPLDDQCFMLECFMSDASRGISAPAGFEDLPDKTWYMSYKVPGDELWQLITDGKITGFSLEGHFKFVPPTDDDEEVQTILTRVRELTTQIKNS